MHAALLAAEGPGNGAARDDVDSALRRSGSCAKQRAGVAVRGTDVHQRRCTNGKEKGSFRLLSPVTSIMSMGLHESCVVRFCVLQCLGRILRAETRNSRLQNTPQ
jgi:hypothetical protein